MLSQVHRQSLPDLMLGFVACVKLTGLRSAAIVVLSLAERPRLFTKSSATFTTTTGSEQNTFEASDRATPRNAGDFVRPCCENFEVPHRLG